MPRYPAGIIRKTPVTPAGPYRDGAALGVWTLADAVSTLTDTTSTLISTVVAI